MSDSKALVKTGIVTTPAIVAGALIAVQFMIAGLVGDIIISAGIFVIGAMSGYLYARNKGAG